MVLPRYAGNIVLGIWLILIGLSAFVNLGDLRKLLDVLAIAAGVLILLSR
jgi:hypothetical protein